MVYYISNKITISDLKKKLKKYTFTFYNKSEVCVISDKYGNSIEACEVKTNKDTIEYFYSKDENGSSFVMHDIAICTKTMFITDSSYWAIASETKRKASSFSFLDKKVFPYVKADMHNNHLTLSVSNGVIFVTHLGSLDEYETEREEYQKWINLKKQAEIAKDTELLFKQIAKMNKTTDKR